MKSAGSDMDTQHYSKVQTETENYSGSQNRSRFRINKRKFARAVFLFGCFIATIIAVFYFSNSQEPAMAQTPQITSVAKAAPSKVQEKLLQGKVIVLDAGHGGFDIGATGVSGVQEADLNLKVAEYLKTDLEQNGAQVIMTRSDQNAIAPTKDEDMAKRRQIIQESGSDIVVSVHMNSGTNPSASGPVVLFMQNSIEGEKLAKAIQESLIGELKPQEQSNARSEGFYILQSGTQPIVIVECGFLSNAEEEVLLKQDGYQQRIAKAITDGIINFF